MDTYIMYLKIYHMLFKYTYTIHKQHVLYGCMCVKIHKINFPTSNKIPNAILL